MEKASKKQQKSQKVTKKINQSYILYPIVLKLGAAGFCRNFTLIYFKKKMPFAFIGIFFFQKNHIFALKNSPPGELWIVL